MGQAESEYSLREAELFRQRISWGLESEGVLDRSGLSGPEIIRNILDLTEKVCRPRPDRMTLSSTDLPRWHRAIFGAAGGPVGRFRNESDGKIGFGMMVFDGAKDSLVPLRVETAPPDSIKSDLNTAFAGYAEKYGDGSGNGYRAVAELWRDVVLVHPFADGNSRTSLVLLQAALHQQGKPRFLMSAEDWELATARSYALRPDDQRSIEPLADLIERRVEFRR